jgi:hypothetical protein
VAMAVPMAQTIGESRRFSVDEIIRMSEGGILRPEERPELVDGGLIVMSPEASITRTPPPGSMGRFHGPIPKDFRCVRRAFCPSAPTIAWNPASLPSGAGPTGVHGQPGKRSS